MARNRFQGWRVIQRVHRHDNYPTASALVPELGPFLWLKRPPTEAALLVLYDAINLRLSLFDRHRSTYRRHTGFIFAFAKLDFPSPANAFGQLNDGVSYSFVFHKMLSARLASGA